MKHIAMSLITVFLLVMSKGTMAEISTGDPAPTAYQASLNAWKTHKFNDNQIQSFVYYWFGLHDKHADVNKTQALLSNKQLLMQFPDGVIHNAIEYKTWYVGVGQHIQSNQHIVKRIDITMLPNHQYQLKVVVNWQAIDVHNQFIDMLATQQWLLVDGTSDWHPYVQQYKVLQFTPVK